MYKKRVLIDLSNLNRQYSGLGQIALNYGKYFKKHYSSAEEYQMYLLLPKKMFGVFGNEVKYLSSTNWLRKHCRYLFPKMDVWHATHQLSRFYPADRSTKYILTIHDLNFLYEKHGKSSDTRKRRLQRKVNRADELVCISNFTKNEVEKHLDLKGKTCKVILNGVEKLFVTEAEKPSIEIQTPFFFTIGEVREKKNFHVLLDLMKLIPDRHLYIAGNDGTDREYAAFIRHRIKDEQINNVTLSGIISQQERIWYYHNCEAFLFPSMFEGFGLPVIEALQFGKPVFSSKETSLKEIGGQYVAFWEDFNPQTMKQVMDNYLPLFLQSPERIAEAQKYALSFSYRKHLEQYMELYEKLMLSVFY
ncbi:MAG: glycosyltransferase family 4 protein [Prevotellaceae bacterium]|jgi:glycosyltransferase involved in cell wall biosynthesis|nr:glycosyltransferase family 4 protein [Prevotellaceae bacterium]